MISAEATLSEPYVVAMTGPLKGKRFSLADELSIGRQDATLELPDMAVSKKHCVIRKAGDRYVIKDLDSHNGTFVNGHRIIEKVLEHGDQILAGESLFAIVMPEEESPDLSGDVEFVDRDIESDDTVLLAADNAAYLQMNKALAASATDERVQNDLTALLRIATAVNHDSGLHSIPDRLMDLIFDVVPADAGAILMKGPGGKLNALFSGGRNGPLPVRVSRTLVNRVIDERAAILINDIPNSVIDAPSLMTSEAHAVLVVPLIVRKRAIGVIYMIRTQQGPTFDQRHLELLTATGAMAALPLETACQVEWLQSENRRLQTNVDGESRMIGNSSAMKDVYAFISRVASTDSTVLLAGESGTGKELVARAIHRMSARSKMPFITVNCAALTETLIESELFGYERGAFTGAISQNKGKFEAADGGTVFLDEIGELPFPMQSKLLRVLQERELNRVGNPRPVKVNVRVIAATNRNLEEEVQTQRFRKDLFYRLNVVVTSLPPLRDRKEDIMLLAKHFVEKFNVQCNRHVTGISSEALSCLMHHDWPGNIRELENAIERAIVLGISDTILPEDLPGALLDNASVSSNDDSEGFHNSVREAKRQIIQRALDECGGSYQDAAKLLGLNRTYLHRVIRTLGI